MTHPEVAPKGQPTSHTKATTKNARLGKAVRDTVARLTFDDPDPTEVTRRLDRIAQDLWRLNQGTAGDILQTISTALKAEISRPLRRPTKPPAPRRGHRGTADRAKSHPTRPAPARHPEDPHPTSNPSS